MFKVLIIDDEEIIKEGLRTVIDWNSMGCDLVGEASDGDEGIEKINELKPDIVFTDIRMPGLNGLEMISKINELKKDCKIVILTGFRDFEYAQEAVKLGAFRFLLKPTNIEDINKTILDAIKEIKKAKTDKELVKTLKKKVKEQYGVEESEILEETSGDKNSKYLVVKALGYMKANVMKELSLKNVADELYISTWYLSKLIKKETGSTFTDILNAIRIEEAKKLLMQPKYKIYEVAAMIGFTDVTYFSKLFKCNTGLKPMEYRNKFFKEEGQL